MRRFIARPVAGVIILVIAGCASVKERPGLTRRNGAYEQFVAASPARVIAAAQETLDAVHLMRVSSGDVSGVYRLVARNAQDTRVTIDVEAASGSAAASRYTVRVEPGEGEGLATSLIGMINARLGTSRTTPRLAPAANDG